MRVRLFYNPPTGSLYAFLSFKLLFWPVQGRLLESAGTAILHPLRRAVCMHFYRLNCDLPGSAGTALLLRVRSFYNHPTGSLHAFLRYDLRVQGGL